MQGAEDQLHQLLFVDYTVDELLALPNGLQQDAQNRYLRDAAALLLRLVYLHEQSNPVDFK